MLAFRDHPKINYFLDQIKSGAITVSEMTIADMEKALKAIGREQSLFQLPHASDPKPTTHHQLMLVTIQHL